jgi:geranylgeranyl diphosphate synthase type I
MISAALHEAGERLPLAIRRIVAYHLGWLDADGHEVEGDGGKALRSAITLLSAEAAGGRAEVALPGAVALELVHNFSLIHDDVMDGDRERRHRPTVWALFGVGEAIIAGDAMVTLAQQLLAEDPRPEARAAALELARATAEMIEGQSEDLAFESRLDVTEDECLAMCGHKTGALLASAGALGAILAGAGEDVVGRLRIFGRNLGLAFQAVDDILGIWGEPSVTGKPSASDLRQHKKTVPVVHAIATGGPVAKELTQLLSNGELSDRSLRRAVSLLEVSGSREWTLHLADQHLERGLAELDRGGLAPGPAADLREIARFVVRRDF